MSEATRSAVFFDFGGVLTTSVFEAFAAFGATISADPKLPLRLLAKDPLVSALLVEHEEGRADDEEFETGFAARLSENGAHVEAAGLLTRMQSGLSRDDRMVELVGEIRRAGLRVGLVSNSLGRDCYAGFDLDGMFDAVVISGKVGVRKPARRIYDIACEQLGVRPDEAVLVDDLQHNLDGAAKIGIAGVLHSGNTADTAHELGKLLGLPTLGEPAVAAS